MRLSTRLLLALWLPLLAVAVAIAFGLSTFGQQISQERADQAARLALSVEATRFSDFFRTRRALLRAWSHTAEARSGDPARIVPLLAAEERAFSELFEGLYFNALDGTVTPGHGEDFKVADRAYFPEVLAGRPVLTGVLTSRATRERIVLMIEPIFDGERLVGAVAGTVVVEDLLRPALGGLGGLRVAVISTGTGELLSPPDDRAALIRSAPPSAEPLELQGLRVWRQATGVRDWALVATRPLADVYEGPRSLRALMGPVLLGLLVAGWFMSRWLSRRLTRSLDSLVSTLERYGAGERDARLSVSNEKDEFSRPARSFNAMADQLALLSEQRRRLELELARTDRLQSLGRLSGGVAHDFNNLLAVILLAGEAISAELGPEHPLRAELEAMMNAAQRSSELTRQLLAFARKQSTRPRELSLDEELAEARAVVDRLLPRAHTLEVRLASAPARVSVDPTLPTQVLMNLVLNARDAMPEGGLIEVLTSSDAQRVRLEVRDHGVGMTAEVQQRLFEPFFSTKGEQGTGLGLATCYGLVTQAGGTIRCDSTSGKGTVFVVELPRVG